MAYFLLKRIFFALLALTTLMVSVFFVVRMTGDPVNLYLPVDASAADRDAMRVRLGLDQPMIWQFVDWAGQMVKLDLGRSIWHDRPALDVVLEALPNTLALGAAALLVAFVGSVVLGSLSAVRPGSAFDRVASVFSLSGASVPDFWLGLMTILVFAVSLRMLPTSGFGGLEYWILPVACLAARPLGTLTQIVRGSMIDALSAPYARTARAKGASGARVVFVHGLRNALLPAITVTGDLAAQFAGGGGVIEIVFGWPGIGRLLVDSILRRDFALVQASILCIAVVIFIINIVVDLIYAATDPRVRLSAM